MEHTGREVLNGVAMSEDVVEPRCAAATIHYMDELVAMEKMMEDMFNMGDVEKVDEPDMKKGMFLSYSRINYYLMELNHATMNVFEPNYSTR